jgi:hypothetical protein
MSSTISVAAKCDKLFAYDGYFKGFLKWCELEVGLMVGRFAFIPAVVEEPPLLICNFIVVPGLE